MGSPKKHHHSLRVIIYGSWSTDWMIALGPSSKIWSNHANVTEVLMVDETNFDLLSPSQKPETQSICIPMMEWHMISYSRQFPALISEANTIRTLALKDAFYCHMEKIGLSHFCPKHYLEPSTISYPAVLKRTDRNGGLSVQYIASMDDLNYHLEQDTWKGYRLILQEWIGEDKEFVTHLVCKNGVIFWHRSFAYTHSSTALIKSPESLILTERIQISDELLNVFESIIKSLNFSGPCSIDFKYCGEGNLKIFEINPRFGGSLMRPENADLLAESVGQILALAT